MSPSDEGLPPSQKVVVDGVAHVYSVYYGPAQIQEGTAKFASDAEHNLEELHPPRSPHLRAVEASIPRTSAGGGVPMPGRQGSWRCRPGEQSCPLSRATHNEGCPVGICGYGTSFPPPPVLDDARDGF